MVCVGSLKKRRRRPGRSADGNSIPVALESLARLAKLFDKHGASL